MQCSSPTRSHGLDWQASQCFAPWLANALPTELSQPLYLFQLAIYYFINSKTQVQKSSNIFEVETLPSLDVSMLNEAKLSNGRHRLLTEISDVMDASWLGKMGGRSIMCTAADDGFVLQQPFGLKLRTSNWYV